MAFLTFDRTYEVFIYYGIFDFGEFKLNSLQTSRSERLRNKHLNDLYSFHVLIDVLEANKDARKIKFKKNSISNNQIEFYKKILDFHNVGLKVRDELIFLIQFSNLNNYSIRQAISLIDSIRLLEKNKLKKQAQILLFFLSISYLNSELFTLDWQEAQKSNKTIYLLLLEPYIDINHLQHDQTKVFKGYEGDYYIDQMIGHMEKDLNRTLDDCYKDYAKQVFLSYSGENESQIDEFLTILSELDWNIRPRYLEKCDQIEVKEKISKIENCEFVIFCLTNFHLQSEQFKQEFEAANSKLMLPIQFENIDENNRNVFNFEEFKMTKLYDSSSFKRFQLFLSRALDLQTDQELFTCKELKVNFSISATSGIAIPYFFSITSDHEMIFSSLMEHRILKRFNFQTGVLIKEMFLNEMDIDYFCWVKHLNKLLYGNRTDCMIYCGVSNESKVFNIKWIDLSNIKRIEMIEYNTKTNQTYLLGYSYESNQNFIIIFDEHLQQESEIKISNLKDNYYMDQLRISNSYVYLWSNKGDHIYVFDSKTLNYLTNFKPYKYLEAHNVFFYSYFVLITCDGLLQIVDSRFFTTIGFIKIPGVLKMVIGDKLIVKNKFSHLFVGKIGDRTEDMSLIDTKFICKINPSKPHVYFHPYFLPCRNSACIECICNYFNIFTNTIKCSFENCKEIHSITRELEKNTIIENNLIELVETISARSLKVLKKSIDIDVFDARFDYTLKLVELRVESVKLEIDGKSTSLISRINSFERKLKDNLNKKSTSQLKINCYKKTLTKFIFGKIGDNDDDDVTQIKFNLRLYYDDNLLIDFLTKALKKPLI